MVSFRLIFGGAVLAAGMCMMHALPVNAETAIEEKWDTLACKKGEWIPLFPSSPKDNRPEIWIDAERVTNVFNPQVRYLFPKGSKTSDRRPLLCIFPGGGYSLEAIVKEGTDIAEWANSMGMVAAVVKYRVSKNDLSTGRFPGPLLDARRAIRLSRKHAKELGIDPEKIGVIGFSAGGHLAGMATTLWNQQLKEEEKDPLVSTSARPDFSMLIYPVITMDSPACHQWSRKVISGSSPTPELLRLCSPEKQVSSKTPPVFLVHAKDDFVSPKNSELMEEACLNNGVPVTRKLYENGGHGYGIEKRGKPTDVWPDDAKQWLNSRHLLSPHKK